MMTWIIGKVGRNMMEINGSIGAVLSKVIDTHTSWLMPLDNSIKKTVLVEGVVGDHNEALRMG